MNSYLNIIVDNPLLIRIVIDYKVHVPKGAFLFNNSFIIREIKEVMCNNDWNYGEVWHYEGAMYFKNNSDEFVRIKEYDFDD